MSERTRCRRSFPRIPAQQHRRALSRHEPVFFQRLLRALTAFVRSIRRFERLDERGFDGASIIRRPRRYNVYPVRLPDDQFADFLIDSIRAIDSSFGLDRPFPNLGAFNYRLPFLNYWRRLEVLPARDRKSV